jgi:hypothetical protein
MYKWMDGIMGWEEGKKVRDEEEKREKRGS